MAGFLPPTDAFSPQRAPLWRPALAFGLGALLVRSELLPPFWALAALGLLTFVLLLRKKKGLLLALMAGAGVAALDLLRLGALQQADPSWFAGEQRIEARIVDVSATHWGSALIVDDVRRADGARLSGRLRLFARRQKLAEGMRIAASVRLRRPFNRGGPGAFDYRAWCFDRGIVATGSVRGAIEVLAPPSWLGRWRLRLRQAMARLEADARGIVQAALLGERGWIAPEQSDRFAAAGIAHLFAISGVHIGAAGLLFAALASALVRLWPHLLAYLTARSVAFAFGALGAWGYALLAGLPPSAVRAAIMFTIGGLAWALGEQRRGVNALAAAWIAILIFDPAAIASLSLWLSFLATLGLLLLPRLRRPVLAGAIATMGAQAASLPISWTAFGWLAPWAWLANLVAAPLFFALLAPLLAAALAAAGGWDAGLEISLRAGAWMAAWLDRWAAFVAALPGSGLRLSPPPLWISALYYAIAALAVRLWLRGAKRRALLGFGAGLGLLVAAGLWPASWSDALFVWDVGQGASAAVVSRKGAVLLVDAPGRKGARITGGMLAAEALRRLRIRRADAVVITHAQADHAGGVADLLRRLVSVRELWLADVPGIERHVHIQRALAEARRKGARIRRLARGDRIELAGMTIEVLWPPKGLRIRRKNDRSLVLLVRTKHCRFLLPGDIERRAEQAIAPALAPVDALLAPHHGSRTSSTPAFVAATRPKWVIFQVGRHNRWHFPHSEVVRRWRAVGARLWQTSNDGFALHCSDFLQWEALKPPSSPRREWATDLIARLVASTTSL